MHDGGNAARQCMCGCDACGGSNAAALMAAMPRNAAALGRHAAAKREIILQIQKKTKNKKTYPKLKIKCFFHMYVFRKKVT